MAEPDGNGRLLAAIDERTQRMDKKMDEHHRDVCKKIDDHEMRLRSLEGSQRWTVGRDLGAYVAAAVVAVKAWMGP